MKRLLSLLGLLLAFALPNHAQTKTDTIKFEVTLEGGSATLDYYFSSAVQNGIEIEWVAVDGLDNGKFTPVAGSYTQTISNSGKVYIYYTYEQSSGYTARIGSSSASYGINVGTNARIASLDVSGCTALTALNCSNNQLTSLDVSKNTALTSLSCANNQLTSLDVSNNTALTELDCRSNQLTSLDVSGCTALKILYCSNNQLTSLDVSGCTALTYLGCEYNQLTSLDVSGCTALTSLGCEYNRLTSLDVSGCTALTILSCGSNQLTGLDVSNNTALKILSCSNNQLTSLDVSGCTALTYLNCENNRLTSLDVSGCTALTYLNCENNRLTALDVSNHTALTDLWCNGNQLTSLVARGCTSLRSLISNSGNAELSSVDASGCTALTSLSFSSRQLTSLDVSGCTALKTLNCSTNKLTSLDVSECSSLEELNCSNNQLTSLDVSKNTDLWKLYCSGNRLRNLDIENNPYLEYLECGNNYIPLSNLYGIYSQNSYWNTFTASGQKDSTILHINQILDLTSEKLLGENLSTFEISPDDAYTENDFTFQFKKVQPYTLTIENTGIKNIPYRDPFNGTALTFTYYISVEIPDGYYMVQVAANYPEWGTATVTGEGLYEAGTEVTITATPKEGCRFVNWTNNDTVFSTEAEYTFAVSENLDLTANFESDTYTVNLASNNIVWGSVSQSGSGIYRKGENVTITATPNHNCRFVNWTSNVDWIGNDTVFSTEAEYTFEVAENLELTAHFEVVSHTVILSSNNAEWGLASLIGNGTYKDSTEATVIATPKTGYRFVNWTKDGAEFSTEAIYTFIVTEDLELTAHFEKIPEEPEGFILSLFADNPEQGYVFRSGNNCTYEEGEEVMILALPKEGYRFDKWTKGDAVFSKEALHTLFVTEDMELTAYFEKLPDDVAIGNPQEDDFHVYVLDHNIILSENRGLVQVFNAIGQCVYSGNATIIPVRQSGVYVVRVGANSHKVIVR